MRWIDPSGLKCTGFWEKAWDNFQLTNNVILGTFAPVGLGFATSRTVAAELGTPTLFRWAWSGFKGLAVGAANLTRLETAIAVGSTMGANFVLVSGAWELGVGVGSIINAGIDTLLFPCDEEVKPEKKCKSR